MIEFIRNEEEIWLSERESRNIVILGLGTGGMYASKAASITDRDARISIVEQRAYDMFSPCGLPYALEGSVKSFDELKYTFPTSRRLRKFLSHRAVKIDSENKSVKIKDVETGQVRDLDYDSLIIATGSSPLVSPIPGAAKLLGKGVHIVSTIENTKFLRRAAESCEKAVIIGAGATGLESAVALRELGLEVIIIEKMETPLSRSFDPDMGTMIIELLKSKGVTAFFGDSVERVNGEERVESVSFKDETISTDLVVVAIGNKPNTGFLGQAEIKTKRGAIETDMRMETNLKGIFAVGDCACTFFHLDMQPIKIELATVTKEQGLVAGTNAVGGSMEYEGTLGTFVSYIGGLEVAATGYNSMVAERRGYDVVTGKSRMKVKPKYIPGAREVTVKLIVDSKNGVVLGAQAIGEEGAAWRVNVAALGIKKKLNIYEFSSIELAYCPPISDLYDPLHAAADIVKRRLSRLQ
jgi:NADH oxidase (H2O2-forming)